MADTRDDLAVPPVSMRDAAPAGMRKIAPRRGPGQESVLGTRRRRRSVRALKLGLPLIMAVSLGYLAFWWLESRDTVVNPDVISPVRDVTEKAEVTVNDVKYDGRDDKGRPYSISAATASHVDKDDRHISLKRPLADMTLASGTYVALTANGGVLDRDADILTLNGDVTLLQDNGLSFQTSSATIDLKAKTAEGNEAVEGQNGKGELTSQGFRVRDDGDTIVFTGKSYVKIYPKQKDQGG